MKKKLFTSLFLILLSFASFAQGETEPYVVIKDGTATFYYNDSKPEGALPLPSLSEYESREWPVTEVITVVFDVSFKEYRPTTCAFWFYNFVNLTHISGMKLNLNTEECTDMSYMFCHCWNLVDLDVSGFNTSKVRNMKSMFDNCSKLSSLNVSKFNTVNVKNMADMFNKCYGLSFLDVSQFNTENVEDMNYMFSGCVVLSSLDVSNFNTAKVTNMRAMFISCEKLTTLVFSNANTQNVTDMGRMFYGCQSLSILDVSNFNTENVTTMEEMFFDCQKLTSVNVSNFNTKNVTNMEDMFCRCDGLTTLDLSNFSTENVTNMGHMFSGCKNIESIFVGDGWVTTSVNSTGSMFGNNPKLYGGKGTAYDDDKTDVTYARIDGGESAPGYFTKSGEPAFITPVSSIPDTQSGIKVWSSNSTIFIESASDTKYTIIDLNGRTIKSATTKSTKEEILMDNSGIYVVIVNGESYKVAVQQ